MSQHRITWPSTTLRVGFGVPASAYSKSGHFGFWWPVLRQTLQQILLFFVTGGLGGAPSPSTAGAGPFLVAVAAMAVPAIAAPVALLSPISSSGSSTSSSLSLWLRWFSTLWPTSFSGKRTFRLFFVAVLCFLVPLCSFSSRFLWWRITKKNTAHRD